MGIEYRANEAHRVALRKEGGGWVGGGRRQNTHTHTHTKGKGEKES
jgi:hypothetical protein